MSQDFKPTRIQQVASTYNVSTNTITDFLKNKGFSVEDNPNAKITPDQHKLIASEFESSKKEKNEALNKAVEKKANIASNNNDQKSQNKPREESNKPDFKQNEVRTSVSFDVPKEPETIRGGLQGTKVVGQIDVKNPRDKQPERKVNPNEKPQQNANAEQRNQANARTPQDRNNQARNNNQRTNDNRNPNAPNKSNFSQNNANDKQNTANPKSVENELSKKTDYVKKFDNTKKGDFNNKNEASKVINPSKNPIVPTNQDRNINVELGEKKESVVSSDDSEDFDAIQGKADKLKGLTVLGRIELPSKNKNKGKPVPTNQKPAQSNNRQGGANNADDRKNQNKIVPAPVKIDPATGVAIASTDAADPEKKKRRRRKRTKKPIASATDATAGSIGQTSRIIGNLPENTANTNNNANRPPRTQNTNGGNSTNTHHRNNDANRNRPQNSNQGTGQNRTTNTTSSTPTGATGSGNSTNSNNNSNSNNNNNRKKPNNNKKADISKGEIDKNIKKTLNTLSSSNKGTGNRGKFRKEKRAAHARAHQDEIDKQASEAKLLRVTEFVSANELASLMDLGVNQVIAKCMQLGMFVSINQRLDADSITMISDEFGFEVEFISTEEDTDLKDADITENPEDLVERAPIVTIMGHVDHGKTTLLDKIRKANVVAGEAGGITQHIGAYNVKTASGGNIAFLDTPGHEAFTAMRARGAKVTDIVIIVVAADDGVMPQTKEAINHALVAGVPIVIAINKVDKPGADPERIRKELAELNILVEDWGGKYQCQEIAAKQGKGITELLEKVLLEAEILELKANPKRKAVGTVIEASLDKGRGYVATLLVQTGTLNVGDVVLAGAHYGKVRAMMDHLGSRAKEAGPSTPVQVLGLDGAPQAGDKFSVMPSEREAREIASKRQQILREQTIRATKRLTLTDIGRRKALGNFQQLNLIVKGDVDGSVEALSDALLKLSSEEVEVNIIHKAVGQVSESDVLLASASEAVIIAFQVRPSRNAKSLADRESIEIRPYSIIYQAIDEVKLAIEGLLAPEVEETIVGRAEVREVFKISKVGTIAGAYITMGSVHRHSKVRVIREGIVLHDSSISTLKRFKDDVTEVKQNYECGIMVSGFGELIVGDEIEAYELKEVKRKLK